MNDIIAYIKERYEPLSLIVYGSYADGSNNQHSDFDALVLVRDGGVSHDASFVGGVQLDLFVYPASYFEGEFDCGRFVQIFDGKILYDTDGRGAALQRRVLSYLHDRREKTADEVEADVAWCRKMLLRTQRRDAEGMFRWHWVLVDSLEIFCAAVGHPYLGPKKALRWMQAHHPEAFARYQGALFELSQDSLAAWISCLEDLVQAQ